ncbi:MAG: Mn(2+) uptake NRAMP transporter MntH [Flavobacteriales bacterium]|nr:Mn(2+) uptake NRAMP transporter MntH [Flavobacteriales bacterium]
MKHTHAGKSLEEVHQSVNTMEKKGFFKKLLAFMGPAYLISVGYMDPGNWATDIAGGSQYGYTLIWVLLMSNIMALLLQSLSARLGIVSGRDLAQASKETYLPFVNFMLYILAEVAIAACDLAEVLGMAIGLQLLFGLPLIWGVCLTVLDTFILLFLINNGMRRMEAFILALVAIIGAAFLVEMVLAQPSLGEIATGFAPSIPDNAALYIAIGIIGATVMPHNLYLHSSLVQTRKYERTERGMKKAIRFNLIDTTIALNLAFFVNAAILILAAATFFKNGMFDVAEIQDAHQFLEPILGSKLAPILFAVALIAAGQSSTLTGTLAGQIVMEGYLNLRIQPWIRRIITRLLAIIPALVAIILFGESSTNDLLILSQVVLSLQLGFAIIPLIHFVSDKKRMGPFTIGRLTQFGAWVCAVIIVGLNVKLVYEEIASWMANSQDSLILWLTVVPIAIGFGLLLVWVAFRPLIIKYLNRPIKLPHGVAKEMEPRTRPEYKKIALAIDFSDTDEVILGHALPLGNENTEFLLLHVVETAGALYLGSEIKDFETSEDTENLERYAQRLRSEGYQVTTKLGYGNPKKSIPELVKAFDADLLVMGAHGHRILKDLLFGTTIDAVRHEVGIPVLVVQA